MNGHGSQVKVILNSATDTVSIIQNFKNFYDLHGPYDILVSSVRDGGVWPRGDFFTIMGLSNQNHYICEIPLAKLTRRGGNFTTALNWYQTKIDKLVEQVIRQAPFYL